MFPLRESKRYVVKFIAALLIASPMIFLGFTVFNYITDVDPKQNPESSYVAKLENSYTSRIKDNWEILSYQTQTEERQILEPQTEKNQSSEIIASDKIMSEKLDKLAEKYKADPVYLDYIIQVEKSFKLAPCELLALIAQESGFKPQTHMDGGSLSYSTTQMKMPTAKTAHMAITKYYNMDIPYPTHELLNDDKYYAAFLAGGYLRYLQDTYNDKYEAYTAYNWGIGGRMTFFKNNGHFKSPYALKVASLEDSFVKYVGNEYHDLSNNISEDQSAVYSLFTTASNSKDLPS